MAKIYIDIDQDLKDWVDRVRKKRGQTLAGFFNQMIRIYVLTVQGVSTRGTPEWKTRLEDDPLCIAHKGEESSR